MSSTFLGTFLPPTGTFTQTGLLLIFCTPHFCHSLPRQPSASHSTLLPWRYLKPDECVRGFRASPSNNPSKPQAASQQRSMRAPVRIGENKLTTVRTTADGELLSGSASLLTIAVVNRQHCSTVGCCLLF